MAEETAKSKTVTIFGPLAHNPSIQDRLTHQGVRFAQKHQDATTKDLIITAHGTSDRTRQEIKAAGFNVQDATCPLVHFAHRSLLELIKGGYYPVIIGKADHIEVRGLTGDLQHFTVVLEKSDIEKIPNRPRMGIMSQTTQPIDRVRSLVESIQAHFPEAEIRFTDTVCHPTKQRQKAAVELGKHSDVVVVIGGKTSNNTRQLSETISRFCGRVHQIETVNDLSQSWFQPEDTVGITAGTSTPDEVIQPVIEQLETWNTSWAPVLTRTHSKVFAE